MALLGALAASVALLGPSQPEAGKVATSTATPATPAGPERSARPPLSWDILAGGIPAVGAVASAQVGFSSLAQVALEVPVVDGLAVGGFFGFDLGYWTPADAEEDGALEFAVTGRLRLLHDAEWSIGASAGLGARFRVVREGGGDFIIPLRARALYAVDKRVLIGGAVDLPIRLGFPDRGVDVFFAVPLTVGLAAELHILPALGITATLGIGPALDTRGVETAFRGTIGIGYRI